ncbi:glycosyltransferase family 4 protein [bacterium]|nr:glycosyltransferase family 4 protein [candidate division CSSED10-310 bacterium]
MLPNFSYGDAIGDDTLALQKYFKAQGHTSDIYSGVIHPYLLNKAYYWQKYRYVSSKDNILVYHFSVGSEINEYLLDIPDRIILIFHNITPPYWFFGVNPHLVEAVADGVKQLVMLKDRVEVAWADSSFNAEILRDFGYQNVRELPIIIDFSKLNIEASKIFARQYESPLKTWLFTGRLSPNKCQEDIIKAFAVYKKYVNPQSRLILAGEARNNSSYVGALSSLINELKIPDVVLTGLVSDSELVALYRMADVFVCMSEHEGFCVPLLEAMHFDVPIIAYAASAIPGTLDGAGILITDKNPLLIAEIAGLLDRDLSFRKNILNGQRRRLDAYRKIDFQSRISQLLEELRQ